MPRTVFPHMDENGSVSKSNIVREKRNRTPTKLFSVSYQGAREKAVLKKLEKFRKQQKTNAARGNISKSLFKWLGKPISVEYDESLGGKVTRYKNFEFDGEIYKRGTSVHLRNNMKRKVPNVGLILDCFESEDDGLQYVRVRWFLREEALPKKLRAVVKGEQVGENNLIIDLNPNIADLLAEDIQGKVLVKPAWEYNPEVIDEGEKGDNKTDSNHNTPRKSGEFDDSNEEEDSLCYYVSHTYNVNKKAVSVLTTEGYMQWKSSLLTQLPQSRSSRMGSVSDYEDQDQDYCVSGEEESEEEYSMEADDLAEVEGNDDIVEDERPVRRKRGRPRKAGKVKGKQVPKRKTTISSGTKRQKLMDGMANMIGGVGAHTNESVENTNKNTAAVDDVVDEYEKARKMLHVSSVPDNLPCRETEFAEIFAFAEGHIVGGDSGSMYISGVPGTGKTATVHEVMRQLKNSADEGDIPEFTFVEINGMQMSDTMQAYTQIWKGLTDDKVAPKQALDLLKRYFTTPSPRRECIVLLVDELDQLISTQHSVMYEIFSWPMSRHARLVVLTIANTMDLPERLLTNKEASRLGMDRVTFEPYTHTQLIHIVSSRLKDLPIFKPEAIELCARKIAATSGDARRCLDICRAATEMAQETGQGQLVKVGMKEIDSVIKRMHKNMTVVSVRTSSKQQQIFLVALLQVLKRTGMEEARLSKVINQHLNICSTHSFNTPSESQISAIARVLSTTRVIYSEPCLTDFHRRIRLNTDPAAVDMALRQDAKLKQILDNRVV